MKKQCWKKIKNPKKLEIKFKVYYAFSLNFHFLNDF